METTAAWAIGAIFSIIIGRYIYAWYSEIDRRKRYMEAQIKLLMHIAAQSGVDKDVIADILTAADLEKRAK